ncbi:TetR family transcriptional regulator [Catenulispora yoronensis]|uniref:TetR family transcriptional regulator n=1 Tax=Catenulispora yoronensis TaxID=450799 RepID=A0ABN2TVW1_9ACTN
MQRDAEATKRRLIDAGRAEFAAHGITGARVDRIAEVAQSNKAQIYHYFKNKAGLFDAVWDDLCRQIVDGLPFDVSDLPGVAVQLSDVYADYPELPRLILWQRLERGEDPPHAVATADLLSRGAAVAAGQRRGLVTDWYEPHVVMAMLLHAAAFWEFSSPDVMAVMDVRDRERRREIVRAMATGMLAESGQAEPRQAEPRQAGPER